MDAAKGLPPDIGFDFDWDDKKVWALPIESQPMRVELLAWHFDVPFWDGRQGDYTITPRSVMEERHERGWGKDRQAHWYRIWTANVRYSIDVMENHGRLTILDGLHRLCHWYAILGMPLCKVRIIPRHFIPLIQPD